MLIITIVPYTRVLRTTNAPHSQCSLELSLLITNAHHGSLLLHITNAPYNEHVSDVVVFNYNAGEHPQLIA